MPEHEFEAILARAAEEGAKRALADVGLEGDEAALDIRDLRSMLPPMTTTFFDHWREAPESGWRWRSARSIWIALPSTSPCRTTTRRPSRRRRVRSGFWGQDPFSVHSQNMTTAARVQAERTILGQRSYRVAILRQSLRRAKLFSIRWRLR
jgi:hypothetical protein